MRTVKVADIDAMGFRSALHVVQEVMPVGKELRKSVTCLLRGFRSRKRRWCTSRSGNAEYRRLAGDRSKDDRAVVVPRAATSPGGVRENLHGSTVNVEPLQFSFREEANRLAIR